MDALTLEVMEVTLKLIDDPMEGLNFSHDTVPSLLNNASFSNQSPAFHNSNSATKLCSPMFKAPFRES